MNCVLTWAASARVSAPATTASARCRCSRRSGSAARWPRGAAVCCGEPAHVRAERRRVRRSAGARADGRARPRGRRTSAPRHLAPARARRGGGRTTRRRLPRRRRRVLLGLDGWEASSCQKTLQRAALDGVGVRQTPAPSTSRRSPRRTAHDGGRRPRAGGRAQGVGILQPRRRAAHGGARGDGTVYRRRHAAAARAGSHGAAAPASAVAAPRSAAPRGSRARTTSSSRSSPAPTARTRCAGSTSATRRRWRRRRRVRQRPRAGAEGLAPAADAPCSCSTTAAFPCPRPGGPTAAAAPSVGRRAPSRPTR